MPDQHDRQLAAAFDDELDEDDEIVVITRSRRRGSQVRI
jgi:hypothetical protein